MSNGILKISRSSRKESSLRKLIPTGISYKGVEAYMNNIGFELKESPDTVKFVDGESLLPYVHIEASRSITLLTEISFNSVPYALLVSKKSIEETQSQLPYSKISELGVELPGSFSFGIQASLSESKFLYNVRWINDPLKLIDNIFGASIAFVAK